MKEEINPYLCLQTFTRGRKKWSYQIWPQSQLLPHGKNGGTEHRPPNCCPSQHHWGDTHPSQAVLVPPCTPRCSPWAWITLSNWPQLSHISSPAHCPYLYLQGCVWYSPSYRSSLNLKGQAKQTGGTEEFWLPDTNWIWNYAQTTLSSPKHTYCLLFPLFTDSEGMQWNRYALG